MGKMHVILKHSTTLGGRYHVFTAPSIKGFYVTGETYESARREALFMLDAVKELHGISSEMTWDVEVQELAAA